MPSKAAQQIRDKLPAWFRMRYDKASVGWQLIEVIGRNFDEAQEISRYVFKNRYLQTADLRQPYECYAARLPYICFESDNSVRVAGEGRVIVLVDDIFAFLTAPVPELGVPHLYQHDIGYLDPDDRSIYLRRAYNASNDDCGYVEVTVGNSKGEIIAQFKAPLHRQPLWNTFDELGILLNTPRLPGEDNESYKLRLVAASRLGGDASLRGYVRALAKELGLFETFTWHDGAQDFIVPHKHVNTETIMVDGELAAEEDIITGPNGQVGLRGHAEYAGRQRTVAYAYGIRVHQLWDVSDPWVSSYLFDQEGFPTEEAVALKEQIDRLAPVKWDHFVWGDAFWDSGGYSLLPNMYDADVSGFVNLSGGVK